MNLKMGENFEKKEDFILKRKRLVALLMTFTMAAGMLAGCGGKADTPSGGGR